MREIDLIKVVLGFVIGLARWAELAGKRYTVPNMPCPAKSAPL